MIDSLTLKPQRKEHPFRREIEIRLTDSQYRGKTFAITVHLTDVDDMRKEVHEKLDRLLDKLHL